MDDTLRAKIIQVNKKKLMKRYRQMLYIGQMKKVEIMNTYEISPLCTIAKVRLLKTC